MAGGRLKAVEFNIQGKHVDAARASLVPGATLDVDVRWTGGTAVTIKKVHGAEAGTGVAPVAMSRQAKIDAQVRAVFG